MGRVGWEEVGREGSGIKEWERSFCGKMEGEGGESGTFGCDVSFCVSVRGVSVIEFGGEKFGRVEISPKGFMNADLNCGEGLCLYFSWRGGLNGLA